MPRTASDSVGSMWYHILHRGNLRKVAFHKPGDWGAFVDAIIDALARLLLDVLGYCLMPDHFHLSSAHKATGTWALGSPFSPSLFSCRQRLAFETTFIQPLTMMAVLTIHSTQNFLHSRQRWSSVLMNQ
jgi:hypothetical protein